MGVVVFQSFMKMNVGVGAVQQGHIFRMNMQVMLVRVRVTMVVFHRRVGVVVVVIFGQHQPGSGQHER